MKPMVKMSLMQILLWLAVVAALPSGSGYASGISEECAVANLADLIAEAKTNLTSSAYDAYISAKIAPELKDILDWAYNIQSSKYTNTWERGWLVAYRFEHETVCPSSTYEQTLPIVAVYITGHLAQYLDILPRGRSGWTDHLKQATNVSTEAKAASLADNYLKGLGISTERLRKITVECFKFSYVPIATCETNASEIHLEESFSVYVAPRPMEMLLRREFGEVVKWGMRVNEKSKGSHMKK